MAAAAPHVVQVLLAERRRGVTGGLRHRAARDRKASTLHTHQRKYSHARNQAFLTPPGSTAGGHHRARRQGPNLRLTGMAATTAVAGILGGALLVAHTPAHASPASGSQTANAGTAPAPVTVPKSDLASYATDLSHQLRVEKEQARKVRLRREREARRRARLRRERERARERRQRLAAAEPSGSPQQIAQALVLQHGWDSSEFTCLDELWNRESGWNVYASNPSSGAYGIPQALPGSKMAEAGPDWQTSALTQIRWGLDYIASTYGSPCSALEHSNATGYY